MPALAGLNFPSVQSWHTPALSALLPATQSTHNVVPATVNLPIEQQVPASLEDDFATPQAVQFLLPIGA